MIGKTKGRKRANPSKSSKEADGEKPKRDTRRKTGGGDSKRKPKQGDHAEIPPPNVPELDSIKDQLTPPPHVTAGHVYSNAYRKHMSLHGKLDVAGAQKAAQLASAIFQAYGIVSAAHIGKFQDKPRRRPLATPQQHPPQDGAAVEGTEQKDQ